MATPAQSITFDDVTLRPITQADDSQVASLIREVLTEHGCTEEGFAIHDPEVDAMTEAYSHARSIYYVVECDGKVVGGCGVAPLRGTYQNIGELQKFYILSDYRGRGIGKRLLDMCVAFAREQEYQRCYVETIDKMDAAGALYRKEGFESIGMPLGNTGHHACTKFYVKVLMGENG
ncbi:MAG: GNAT family N-acetyltransferase [Rickettsiales bacterium]